MDLENWDVNSAEKTFLEGVAAILGMTSGREMFAGNFPPERTERTGAVMTLDGLDCCAEPQRPVLSFSLSLRCANRREMLEKVGLLKDVFPRKYFCNEMFQYVEIAAIDFAFWFDDGEAVHEGRVKFRVVG